MENKDWLNDYMSLKQVNPVNPFTVPAGYFDDLRDRIVSRKNLEEIKNNTPEEGFTVPENYFNELTTNIQSRINIETVTNNEDAGFTVPDGYFDELASTIQSRIAIESIVNEDAGFAIPENYFDELSANIQSRIAIESIVTEDAGFAIPENYFDELSDNIRSRIAIEDASGEPSLQFSVPDGYFEKLNQSILNKTVNEADTKRRGIVRQLFHSTAFKYATAACFALVIGGGILLREISSPVTGHKNSFLHEQLSNVPLSDIKSYLQLNVDAGDTQQTVATEGAQVNDDELKNALQNYVDSVQ